MTTFFSFNALESQRSSGYKNTAYALAELIDNSFDANANNVEVYLIEKRQADRLRISEILIADDGDGMGAELLQEALQFGRTTNSDMATAVRQRKKGKFGYGLPNASLSQCKKIDVYSWKTSDDPNYVYFDLEELRQTQSIEIPLVKAKSLPAYYNGLLGPRPNTGTIVAWNECDRLSHVKGETIISYSESVLGQIYRHLLVNGKSITFHVYEYNDTKKTYVQQKKATIRPNDPLFLMKDTLIANALWKESKEGGATGISAAYYSKFVSSPTECSPTSERLEDKCYTTEFRWRGKEYKFDIATSIANIDIQKPGKPIGGDTFVGKFYSDKEERGNISFVRADREIESGTFGKFYNRTILPSRYWSIEVKFSADSDDLLGLSNNKQSIEFRKTTRDPEEFDEHFADLAQARVQCWMHLSTVISDCISAAQKKVRKQSKEWDATHTTTGGGTRDDPLMPTSTDDTTETIIKVDGSRQRTLSKENLEMLENRLIEKYSSIDPELIKNAIERLDKSLTRACVLYAPTESRQLWTYTKVYDFIVVLVNSNHEFYLKVLSECRNNGQEGVLTVIELFISSLAIEEDSFATNREHIEILEDFRESVGSKLFKYIRELPEEIIAKITSREDDDDEES